MYAGGIAFRLEFVAVATGSLDPALVALVDGAEIVDPVRIRGNGWELASFCC